MIETILLSPPAALGFFLALAYGLYRLGGALAAEGEETPGKRQPYACGEDLLSPEVQLDYHAFFRLTLLFAVLHLATLVVSTLPLMGSSSHIAATYLVTIAISIFALTKEKR